MAFNFKNESTIIGSLYEHRLSERVTGERSKNPGTKFISGDVILETEPNNLITVTFPYVTEFGGKEGTTPNQTFAFLRDIINGTIASKMGGATVPARLRVARSAMSANDYFDARNTKEVVTSPYLVNRGGYLYHASAADENKARFEADVLFTSVVVNEPNGDEVSATLHGYVFSYNGAIQPATFEVVNNDAIDYFTSQDISPANPFFTFVKGYQRNCRVKTSTNQEGAFSTSVSTSYKTERRFVIDWAKTEPHLYNDESTIDDEFIKKALADRETMKSDLKTRGMERMAATSPVTNMPSNMPGAFGGAPVAGGAPAWTPPTPNAWGAPAGGQPTAVPSWSTAAPAPAGTAPSWAVSNL